MAGRASSPSHHLRASAGEAPAATVSATRSSAPALTMASSSGSDTSHSARSRARTLDGASGSVARICATQSAGGATGTRSGSGKYR